MRDAWQTYRGESVGSHGESVGESVSGRSAVGRSAVSGRRWSASLTPCRGGETSLVVRLSADASPCPRLWVNLDFLPLALCPWPWVNLDFLLLALCPWPWVNLGAACRLILCPSLGACAGGVPVVVPCCALVVAPCLALARPCSQEHLSASVIFLTPCPCSQEH